ncbi:MAG: TlpA disulfide reductase family protein [Chitinophagales bacterium]
MDRRMVRDFLRNIKRALVVAGILMLPCILAAQEIKKINVKDLQAYIQESSHPLIVNFWATYCVPCIEEIPYFQKAVVNYKDKGIELLLVSLDLPGYFPEKITAFAQDKHFTAPIVWLNETNADYFCPIVDKRWSGGIPSSLFINNKTHFRKFFERQLTEQQLEETIQNMLH